VSTLSVLLNAVLRASATPAQEPPISLLTEVRRLPSFWNLAETEDDVPAFRVVYRLPSDLMGFGCMDLYRGNRYEGTVEAFSILKLQREYGFNQLEAERFCDYAWNFRWVLLNSSNRRYTQELSLHRILDAVDLGTNDLVIGEEG